MTSTWLIGLEDWCDWVCYCQITGLQQSDGRIRRHQIWNPLRQTLQVNFVEEKKDKHQVHICWFETRLNLLKPHSLFSHIWLLTRFLLLQKWRVRRRKKKKSTCIKNNSGGMKKCRIEPGSSVRPLEVLLFFPRKFSAKVFQHFSPQAKNKKCEPCLISHWCCTVLQVANLKQLLSPATLVSYSSAPKPKSGSVWSLSNRKSFSQSIDLLKYSVPSRLNGFWNCLWMLNIFSIFFHPRVHNQPTRRRCKVIGREDT